MANSKDKRCALLWNHIRVAPHGQVTPCCLFDPLGVTDEYPEMPDISNGLEAAFNSDFFNYIREKMIKGEEPEPCKWCYELETMSEGSHRLIHNKLYDVDAEPKIRYVHTGLTNHCNLACRMCGPRESTKWVQYLNPKEKVDINFKNSVIDYYDADLSELDRVKFTGGEPLIDKHHVKFLEKLFDMSKDPSSIQIEYTTNGTVRPNASTIEFWKRCKSVLVEFSVDGIGEVNEILRPPHKWEKILDTIEYIKSIDNVNFKFEVGTVVSVANILCLNDILDWSIDTFNVFPNVTPLEHPKHLSMFYQKQDVRLQIIEHLKTNLLGKYSKYNDTVDQSIMFAISRLHNDEEEQYSLIDVIEKDSRHDFYKDSIQKLLTGYK